MADPHDDRPLVTRSSDAAGVLTLTLNRGERFNPLSFAMIAALHTELESAARDESIRVVVLAGAGRGFSAGHDLKEMRAHAHEKQWQRELFDACGRMMLRLTTLPQPVIARVHGIATAAGCQLVSMCDLAVASEAATFALPGVNIGVFCSTPAVGVARNIGRKPAMEMLLTGAPIDARDGARLGPRQPRRRGRRAGCRRRAVRRRDPGAQRGDDPARQAGVLRADRTADRAGVRDDGRSHGVQHAPRRCVGGHRRVSRQAHAGLEWTMMTKKESGMALSRMQLSVLGVGAALLLATPYIGARAEAQSANAKRTALANPITGEGLPNPAPNVTRNWGQLPAGRKWGTSAGIDIDPIDGNVWAYERCGANGSAGGSAVDCDNAPLDPIFKFDRKTGAVLANFGKGVMVTPHGIAVDKQGNVWFVADFAGNKAGTKGHQVHKFSPKGALLMSLGTAGKPGNADGQFNQPNAVVVGPDGSIYVADGHDAQGMTTAKAVADGIARGATSRISKFTPEGKFIKSWGSIGYRHGEFRTPHALKFDAQGRLWVADRGNHRIEIFDQNGTYLESRYMFSRPSGIFIKGDTLYVIDSESSPYTHPNWHDGVRIGPLNEDRVTGYIPPFEREDRGYQGTAGEGVAVDADGNVFAAEGPNSINQAGGAFTNLLGREVGSMGRLETGPSSQSIAAASSSSRWCAFPRRQTPRPPPAVSARRRRCRP